MTYTALDDALSYVELTISISASMIRAVGRDGPFLLSGMWYNTLRSAAWKVDTHRRWGNVHPDLNQAVAQSVEFRTWNAEVVGSSPASLTIALSSSGRTVHFECTNTGSNPVEAPNSFPKQKTR